MTATSVAGSADDGRAAGRPLLSACLIVKDEAEALPECLASLVAVVDEIVVHDTGSTDATVAIANEAGALVVEGTWADDFGAARNTSLAASTAEWVLSIDADEVLIADAARLRAWIGDIPAGIGAVQLEIENLVDDGTGSSYRHRACRLFRRERAHWSGRIHEQVVARPGHPPLTIAAELAPARIVHSGYLSAAMAKKDKVQRNLALLESVRRDSPAAEQDPALLLDLGRALKASGRLADASDRLLDAAQAAPGTATARTALEFATSCLLGLGRVSDARAAVTRLRAISNKAAMADFLDGQALLQSADPEAALHLFAGIDELVNDEGRRLGDGLLPLHRGTALALLGRWREAADELAVAVGRHGAVAGNVGPLLDAYRRAGHTTEALGRVLAPVAPAVFLELERLDPAAAAEILEALWTCAEAPAAVVDRAVTLSPKLPLDAALTWSIRLRERGDASRCPLISLTGDVQRSPRDRLYAAALALALGDPRGSAALATTAPEIDPQEFGVVLVALNDFAPVALPSFLAATATDAARSRTLAVALEDLGASEQASALLRHAEQLATSEKDDNLR